MKDPASTPCISPIKIVMDDRESLDVMLPFLESNGFIVETRRLSVADYLVNSTLLVERKTLPDLVRSIIDGRLFHQAKRLVEAKHPAALILEGSSRDLQESGMRREAIQGALVTHSLFYGLPVLRSASPCETARTLAYVAHQQVAVDSDTLTRHARRPKRKAALQSYILQGLPGVGPKRAKLLLARFGSVEGVITAGSEALAQVDGFGPETIRKIRRVLE